MCWYVLVRCVQIQRLQNEFVVELYQTHARIALEHGDVNEFHQCQTQLFPLHARGLGSTPSHREFLAYRLLYYVYTRNATEVRRRAQVPPPPHTLTPLAPRRRPE